jgi:hypothetical protein
MIDISNEFLLTISAAAKSLPSRPHISTVWRWIQRGVRGVKLETYLIGGRRFTSREALERFQPQRRPRQTAKPRRSALPVNESATNGKPKPIWPAKVSEFPTERKKAGVQGRP